MRGRTALLVAAVSLSAAALPQASFGSSRPVSLAAKSKDCGTARLDSQKVFNLTVSGIDCPAAKAALDNKEIYWADIDPDPFEYNPGLASNTGWGCSLDRLKWGKATCVRAEQRMVWWGVPKAYRDCMARPIKKGRPRDCGKLLK